MMWRAISPSPNSGNCLRVCAECFCHTNFVSMNGKCVGVLNVFFFIAVFVCGFDQRMFADSHLCRTGKKPKTLALICIALVGTIEFGFCTST